MTDSNTFATLPGIVAPYLVGILNGKKFKFWLKKKNTS